MAAMHMGSSERTATALTKYSTSEHNKENSNTMYYLDIKQQPQRARMCGLGDKADRRPLDPPPIIRLRIRNSHQSRGGRKVIRSSSSDMDSNGLSQPTLSHTLFMFASLVAEDNDEELYSLSGSRTKHVLGSVVSSLFHLSDQSCFVFPDLSIRTEGRWRFRMSLYELVESGVEYCTSIFTEVFQVYPSKKFPGMSQSTELSKAFASQGLRLRVRRPAKNDRKAEHSSTLHQPEQRILTPVRHPLQPQQTYSERPMVSPWRGMEHSRAIAHRTDDTSRGAAKRKRSCDETDVQINQDLLGEADPFSFRLQNNTVPYRSAFSVFPGGYLKRSDSAPVGMMPSGSIVFEQTPCDGKEYYGNRDKMGPPAPASHSAWNNTWNAEQSSRIFNRHDSRPRSSPTPFAHATIYRSPDRLLPPPFPHREGFNHEGHHPTRPPLDRSLRPTPHNAVPSNSKRWEPNVSLPSSISFEPDYHYTLGSTKTDHRYLARAMPSIRPYSAVVPLKSVSSSSRRLPPSIIEDDKNPRTDNDKTPAGMARLLSGPVKESAPPDFSNLFH